MQRKLMLPKSNFIEKVKGQSSVGGDFVRVMILLIEAKNVNFMITIILLITWSP